MKYFLAILFMSIVSCNSKKDELVVAVTLRNAYEAVVFEKKSTGQQLQTITFWDVFCQLSPNKKKQVGRMIDKIECFEGNESQNNAESEFIRIKLSDNDYYVIKRVGK